MSATCRIPNLMAFVAGHHNGETYDEGDIDELVGNFDRVKGFWKPYVALGHARIPQYAEYHPLSFGDVTAVRKGRVRFNPATHRWEPGAGPDSRAALFLDAENVPREFGELVKSRQLPRRSVEFFDHTCPIRHPADGRPILTNVLKCISFLGSHPECVKGMPDAAVAFGDLPARGRTVTFPHRLPGRAKCFGAFPMEPTVMDAPPTDTPAVQTPMGREQLIELLTKAGYDPTMFTEGVPDALLQQMADMLGKEPPTAQPVLDANGDGIPDAAVKAFGDKAPVLMGLLNSALAKSRQADRGVLDYARRAAAQGKAQKISSFGDRMTGANGATAYMTPVQFASLRPSLEALDDAAVKTFGDKTTGTALDKQLAALSAAFATPVKTFGDRVSDPIKDKPPTAAHEMDAWDRMALNADSRGKLAMRKGDGK